jgi:hypothetical protein
MQVLSTSVEMMTEDKARKQTLIFRVSPNTAASLDRLTSYKRLVNGRRNAHVQKGTTLLQKGT